MSRSLLTPNLDRFRQRYKCNAIGEPMKPSVLDLSPMRFFTASQATAALFVEGETLRIWRKRGICSLGQKAATESGVGHWKYSRNDLCQMAFAVALSQFGFSLEEAFRISAGDEILSALSRTDTSNGPDDLIFGFVKGAGPQGVWGNSAFFPAGDIFFQIEKMWDAEDPMGSGKPEQVMQINVSRIIRRVDQLLAAGLEGAK
jgi:hypothetical protein